MELEDIEGISPSNLGIKLWGVVVLVGDGGDEAGLSVHVVGDGHEAAVRQPHAVLPLHPP